MRHPVATLTQRHPADVQVQCRNCGCWLWQRASEPTHDTGLGTSRGVFCPNGSASTCELKALRDTQYHVDAGLKVLHGCGLTPQGWSPGEVAELGRFALERALRQRERRKLSEEWPPDWAEEVVGADPERMVYCRYRNRNGGWDDIGPIYLASIGPKQVDANGAPV
jgi:hypothetical protein